MVKRFNLDSRARKHTTSSREHERLVLGYFNIIAAGFSRKGYKLGLETICTICNECYISGQAGTIKPSGLFFLRRF